MEDKRTQKRRKLSKNKKKSWKKTDITDVEEFLEDQRLQERTGGLVAEKTDAKLFYVDNKLEEESQKKVSRKRQRNEPKLLKCHANLQPNPNIKPARILHNIRKEGKRRETLNVLEREAKGFKSAKQRQKELQWKKTRQVWDQKRTEKHDLRVINYDIWKEDPEDMRKLKGLDAHYLQETKKRRVNPPPYYREKVSGIPVIEVPHPGASYNPAYDDHQDLLEKATEDEMKKIVKERRIFKALEAKFPTADEAPTQENWIQEMSAGLYEEGDSDPEYTAEELEHLSVNPPVHRDNLKTQKQKRKQQEKRKEAKIKSETKLKKLRQNDIFRLRNIKAEVKAREAKLIEVAERKATLKELYKDKPKRLGKLKYEAPDLEVKLTEELVGSLRLLKPEGHVLEDRFRSLQKRNIIEPRIRAKINKSKYKPKAFEKKGHKAITL